MLAPAARRYAPPIGAGAAVLALFALGAAMSSLAAGRWALPALIAGGGALTLGYHRGRLSWLAEPTRLGIATLGLLGAALPLPAWAQAMLALALPQWTERAQALLPLAALYAVGAYLWPGRLRRPYDQALQTIGVVLAAGSGVVTLIDHDTRLAGMLFLASFWMLQTILRRHWMWGALALGNAMFAGAIAIERVDQAILPERWFVLGLCFTATYLIGAPLLRRTRWRFLTWPAVGWGALAGAGTLLLIGLEVDRAGVVMPRHTAAVLALAAVLVLASWLWRAAWPGYLVAGLLTLATLMSASRGFFTAWQPMAQDDAYVLCGLALGLALVGQGVRRANPRYAYPYELVGYALLALAPLSAFGSLPHLTIVWTAVALLYALAVPLYRLRWAAAPALLAADLALLNGSAWLGPGGRPSGAGLLLLGTAWVQGLLGLWSAHRQAPHPPSNRIDGAQPAYVVAVLSGLGALLLASGASDTLATVAFGLALLLALVGMAHRRELGAWAALALLAIGLASLHQVYEIRPLWSMAWGVAEALALCVAGWLSAAVDRSGNQRIAIWHRPLWLAPLLAGLALVGALLVAAQAAYELPPLIFALATVSLLLATLAVRRRALGYAYGAGAALVAAGLFQLHDWGFRQPQWFVIPAGLYLLALAEGLRRFEGQRRLSQVIQSGATMLLLGVTLGQSLRAEGATSQLYAVWLCVEALLMLGYGMLLRLRVPFFGGAAFFVAGVLWLSIDPLLSTNKWVLLGILGLVLVGIYVLLERRQEQLVRTGRDFVERVSGWS
jgi:hypothetical protein